MKFYIKDNNLYYYNYLITDRSLSLFLVPIAYIILFSKNLIPYFSYIFAYIALIGTLDAISKFFDHKLYLILVTVSINHLILLYPVINFKENFKPNISNYLFGLLALLIIYFLPYWPYKLTKSIFISVLLIVYIVITLLYCYFFDYKFSNFLH